MEDDRIPKRVFFGQMSSGKRPQCGPIGLYKDTVKTNMKRCSLRPKSLSTAPFDRAQWCTTCQLATASFEESRVAKLDRKWAARKQQAINTTGTVWPCDRCNRTCSSRIGLFTHQRVAKLDRKWAARKQQAINTTGMVWPCDRCNRTCLSRIGLFTHRRTHR